MAKYNVYVKAEVKSYGKNEEKASEIVKKWLLEQDGVTQVEVIGVEKE